MGQWNADEKDMKLLVYVPESYYKDEQTCWISI